jgi:hypothetical protein
MYIVCERLARRQNWNNNLNSRFLFVSDVEALSTPTAYLNET